MRRLMILLIAVSLILPAERSFAGNTEDTDYIQLLIYGQSLALGWQCPRAITTTAIDGNYMLGDNPIILHSNQLAELNPLVATKWVSGGEPPIVSCVNVFSQLYRENINANQKFIGMTGGEGGRTIERLSKECTNSGYYESTFIKILDNTLAALQSEETVSCPAIIYMQGESNCNSSSYYGGQGMTPGSDGVRDKEGYKALLLQLKNNMQADIMEKYGQTKKPLFFIYQTSGTYLKMKEMPIAMAQYEFADENEDVILLNPHYALPDYSGGHLSSNGYRWYGEMIGKIVYDVLVDDKPYHPVYPESFSINDKEIIITYHVPVLPLVLDTWTNKKATNFGFAVYRNKALTQLKSVEVREGNKVVITCSGSASLSGDIEVVYAGTTTQGTGNLRDSYDYTSLYTYFNDSSDSPGETYIPTNQAGIRIYGQPYPMQNWSVGFYQKIPDETAIISTKITGDVTIYPNPVTNFLYLDAGYQTNTVKIFDVNGKIVYSGENETVINVSHLAKGLYLLQDETAGEIYTTKLIKN